MIFAARDMWHVYVLFSEKDGGTYCGSTNDVERRLQEHNKGWVSATLNRRPLHVIFLEACEDEEEARRRERYFKSAAGRRQLRKQFEMGR